MTLCNPCQGVLPAYVQQTAAGAERYAIAMAAVHASGPIDLVSDCLSAVLEVQNLFDRMGFERVADEAKYHP